jgi:hypothetical protein
MEPSLMNSPSRFLNRLAKLAVMASLAVALVAMSSPSRAQPVPQLKRGSSIHQAFNWPSVSPTKTVYVWPPFERPGHQVSDERLRAAANAGFDFIRVTIDPGPFMTFEGAQRAELDTKLMTFVRRIRTAGMNVLLNFHPIHLNPAFVPNNFIADPDDPFMQRYYDMLGRIARQLAAIDPGHVGIEPLNEPQTGYDRATMARWQANAEKGHAVIRAVAPDLLVVLTGARAGGINGLLQFNPKPFDGSNVMYSFHFYEPYEFSHQGVRTGAGKYVTGIHYPAKPSDYAEYYAQVERRIQAAALSPDLQYKMLLESRTSLKEYFEFAANAGMISQRFDQVSAWAKANNISPDRIVLGEFGARRDDFNGAQQVHRLAYLKDVREAAEKRRFGWAVWLLDFSEMGLAIDRTGAGLQPDTLEALGLKPQ